MGLCEGLMILGQHGHLCEVWSGYLAECCDSVAVIVFFCSHHVKKQTAVPSGLHCSRHLFNLASTFSPFLERERKKASQLKMLQASLPI